MILFVCRGNMVRSQIAKAFFNELTRSKDADSCGTWVTREGHEGKLLAEMGCEFVVRHMKSRGLDLSREQAKQITLELVERADRIIVMAESETWPPYLLNSPKVSFWEVENPPDMSIEDVARIADLLKVKCDHLVQSLN
jgi:protein-tyrosine-phosphatase